MDVFVGRGKKKRAKAFVTLRIMEDNRPGGHYIINLLMRILGNMHSYTKN